MKQCLIAYVDDLLIYSFLITCARYSRFGNNEKCESTVTNFSLARTQP